MKTSEHSLMNLTMSLSKFSLERVLEIIGFLALVIKSAALTYSSAPTPTSDPPTSDSGILSMKYLKDV